MQDDAGLKKVLTMSWAYELFQRLVGASRVKRWLATHCWRLKGGEKVVDIGCGPGAVLAYLPKDIRYVGFDISSTYIESAKKQWGSRGEFIVGTAATLLENPDERLSQADLIFCNGLLHHLDDAEVMSVLELARQSLAPGGRLVIYEPTFLLHQSRWSSFIMKRDRGRNIRTDAEWRRILTSVFSRTDLRIVTGLLRIPYVSIVAECVNSPQPQIP